MPIDSPAAEAMSSLDEREHATVLAALRFWQRNAVIDRDERDACAIPEEDIATDGGSVEILTSSEIDDLCERMNNASPPVPEDDRGMEPSP